MIGASSQRLLSPRPRRDAAPASHLQRDLWTWVLDQPPAAVTHARAVRLLGGVDPERLLAVLERVVRDLDVLDVNLREAGGDLLMVGRTEPHAVTWAEIAGPTPDARDERCLRVMLADRDRPVDPRRDQLARFHVMWLGPDEVVLGLVAHALALDLRSVHTVLATVLDRCQRAGGGAPAAAPRFAELAAADPLASLAGDRWRLGWWAQRLAEWRPAPTAGTRRTGTAVLLVDDERWRRLADLVPAGGNTSGLAAIALLAWCLRVHDLRDRTAVFRSVLDLRDLLRLPPVVGPLSDHHVFAVDLADFNRLTFGDLVLRTHAGLLDAVGCYVPYGSLAAQAAARHGPGALRPAALWDFFVHYCRNPPRGAGGTAEPFGETRLVSRTGLAPGASWDGGNFETHVAGAGDHVAVVLDFNELLVDRDSAERMLTAIDVVIDRVIAEPGIPLRRL